MSTFSSNIGPEEEDGGGWGGLVPSKTELREEAEHTRARDELRHERLVSMRYATQIKADEALLRQALEALTCAEWGGITPEGERLIDSALAALRERLERKT